MELDFGYDERMEQRCVHVRRYPIEYFRYKAKFTLMATGFGLSFVGVEIYWYYLRLSPPKLSEVALSSRTASYIVRG
jgi:hypothetical protein